MEIIGNYYSGANTATITIITNATNTKINDENESVVILTIIKILKSCGSDKFLFPLGA